MQITKTKSGRLAYSIYNSVNEDGIKGYMFFAIIESKEQIADKTRRFYYFCFGFSQKDYNHNLFHVDFENNFSRREYCEDYEKFNDKSFSDVIKKAMEQNEANHLLYSLNKYFGCKITLLSEVENAKLYEY